MTRQDSLAASYTIYKDTICTYTGSRHQSKNIKFIKAVEIYSLRAVGVNLTPVVLRSGKLDEKYTYDMLKTQQCRWNIWNTGFLHVPDHLILICILFYWNQYHHAFAGSGTRYRDIPGIHYQMPRPSFILQVWTLIYYYAKLKLTCRRLDQLAQASSSRRAIRIRWWSSNNLMLSIIA